MHCLSKLRIRAWIHTNQEGHIVGFRGIRVNGCVAKRITLTRKNQLGSVFLCNCNLSIHVFFFYFAVEMSLTSVLIIRLIINMFMYLPLVHSLLIMSN